MPTKEEENVDIYSLKTQFTPQSRKLVGKTFPAESISAIMWHLSKMESFNLTKITVIFSCHLPNPFFSLHVETPNSIVENMVLQISWLFFCLLFTNYSDRILSPFLINHLLKSNVSSSPDIHLFHKYKCLLWPYQSGYKYLKDINTGTDWLNSISVMKNMQFPSGHYTQSH